MSDMRATQNGFHKTPKPPEETFVTMGKDNPQQQCENCGKTVDRQKYQLHFNFCVKNNTKCSFCGEAVSLQELQQHIDEAKGDADALSQSVQQVDLPALKRMQEHGADVFSARVSDGGLSLMHLAVKLSPEKASELITFVQTHPTGNIDVQNSNGETALHLCVGRDLHPEMARLLVMHGANCQVKNALGETPMSVAQRNGHHDLVMLMREQL